MRRKSLLALLALAPPAVCIGATLPVMSRVYARHSGRVGRDVGGLYAANTFGSVLGSVLTVIFLIRLLGLREAVLLTSAINGSLVGTWWLRRRRASLAHFGGLELGIGLLAVLALFAFAQLPRFRLEDVFGAYSSRRRWPLRGCCPLPRSSR